MLKWASYPTGCGLAISGYDLQALSAVPAFGLERVHSSRLRCWQRRLCENLLLYGMVRIVGLGGLAASAKELTEIDYAQLK